jgi:hypothetical protein
MVVFVVADLNWGGSDGGDGGEASLRFVVVVKVVVVASTVCFSKGCLLLCWFLTLLFRGCVRAAERRWWKLFSMATCDVG